MDQRIEDQFLQPCTNAERWFEWSQQSLILFLNWLREIPTSGLRGSPTATWFATTPWGINDICRQLELDSLGDDDTVVEIGPGPGPMPQAILRNTRKNIRYLAIELNPRYAERLTTKIKDPRLEVVNDNASRIGEIIRERRQRAKLVLSSMPFSKDTETTLSILHQVRDQVLRPDGQLMVWNFTPTSIQQVEEVFDERYCKKDRIRLNAPFLRTILADLPPKPIIPFPVKEVQLKDAINQ